MTSRRHSGIHLAMWLALVFGVIGSARAQQTEPRSGCVVSVRGEVVVAHRGRAVRATEGLALLDGDTLIVRGSGNCRGFTPAGEMFALDGPARMALAPWGSGDSTQGIRHWIARQLAVWTGQSRRQALTTRGGRTWESRSDPCRPLFPVANGAVRAGSARFCWATIPGIEQYEIVIAREGGQDVRRQVRGNTVVLSDLEAGAEYLWRIEPVLAGWTSSPRWYGFRMLTREQEAQLDAALAKLPDLEAAVLLLSFGLNEEAVYRLDAVREAEPGTVSALRWRADAFAAMGLDAEAIADLREAARLP